LLIQNDGRPSLSSITLIHPTLIIVTTDWGDNPIGLSGTFIAGDQLERLQSDFIALEQRDGLLNNEIFYRLKEARIVIEQWRMHAIRSDRNPRSTSR